MEGKKKGKVIAWQFLLIGAVLLVLNITSCSKQGSASATGLNVYYQILNLSPDVDPVNLFIDFKQVNTTPYVFTVNQGYCFVPSLDIPYQIRTTATSGATLLSRNDTLKSGAKYSLYIVGNVANKSLTTIFTVDTSKTPTAGRGKIRFVDASPSGTSGLDVYANGTLAFSKVVYPNFKDYIEVPVGNYDIQITPAGSAAILKELPSVTVQDGRLYTIYAYGYSNRTDTAAFSAAVLTNK